MESLLAVRCCFATTALTVQFTRLCAYMQGGDAADDDEDDDDL
eukprot:SAG31_NODE_11702_length_1005_cov_1.381898_2_plen_43_part_00